MAARKLQAEIDRVLKRVAEGVEAFDNTYKKMEASTNLTQKEKLEADLKTQIKKLQRLRDQIKTWVASNDIKDKSQLLENRKLIETQMERFKACEKEMKTKAFSKEGLIQASKLDPKAQEKLETTQWLQTKVEELLLQVEQAEAEVETLQGGAKKKKSGSSNSRLEQLEHLNERRKWHISRLEIVLRLLDNGSLPVEKVLGLKDDVTYFVESNTEDDFDEDEGIYDEMNLDEEEEKFGLVADEGDSDGDSEDGSEDIPPRTPSKKADDDSPTNHKRDEQSPVQRRAGIALNIRKSSTTEAPKPPPPISASSQPMSSVLKNGLPSRPPAALPVRYATAAAAAVSSTSSLSTPSAVGQTSSATAPPTVAPIPTAPSNGTQSIASTSTTTHQSLHDAAASSPSLTQASVSGPSPMLSSASVSGLAAESSTYSAAQSPVVSEAVHSPVVPQTESPRQTEAIVPTRSPSTAPTSLPDGTAQNEPQETNGPQSTASSEPQQLAPPVSQQQVAMSSPLPQQLQQFNKASASASGTFPVLPSTQVPAFPPGTKIDQQGQGLSGSGVSLPPQRLASVSPSVQQQQAFGTQMQQQARGTPSAFPGSLSDLVASFETVKQKASHRMNNLDQVHKLLDGSYHGMPQPLDTEKPKYYVPKNPFPTPPYYPQAPHPILSSPTLFQNLDVETLFYVFYYLPGTYQQYLAAKELKRQSWRFHVKYLTWFQRHSEPQAITDEYEQGVYVYFDWEGSWCQRKKSDFRFEYRYLSED